MSGIRHGGQRPKTAKHLRAGTEKQFRNEDPDAKARYALKIAARLKRKQKKVRSKGARSL